MTGTPQKLTPVNTLGTAGSFDNAGNTVAKATDGDPTTFFDAPGANGDWLAVDLGSPRTVVQIGYAPRAGFEGRMVGGYFQAANDLTGKPVTLATITAQPVAGGLTYVVLPAPVTYRYFSYVGPAGSYGNIAEFQVFGPAPVAVPAVQVQSGGSPVPLPPPQASPATPAASFTIGVGAAASASGTYTAVAAPAPVAFDATGCATRDDVCLWNFGDPDHSPPLADPRHKRNPARWTTPTYTLNVSLGGRCPYYLYAQPGTYTVTLTVLFAAGGAATVTRTVEVPKANRTAYYFAATGNDGNTGTDPDHPWYSPVQFARCLHGRNNVEVHVAAGTTLKLDGQPTVRLASNVWVDNQGTLTHNGLAFDTWPGQSSDTVVSGGAFIGTGPAAEVLFHRGDNAALSGVTCSGTFNRIAEANYTTWHGLLVQGCDLTAADVGSESVSGWGGDGTNAALAGNVCGPIAVHGNVGIESDGEIDVRTDGIGVRGVSIQFNGVSTPTAAGASNGKAVICIRSALHADVLCNDAYGICSVDTTKNTTQTSIQDARFAGNEVAQYHDLRGTASGLTVDGDNFPIATRAGIGVSSTAAAPVTGVRATTANTGPGAGWWAYQDAVTVTGGLPQFAHA